MYTEGSRTEMRDKARALLWVMGIDRRVRAVLAHNALRSIGMKMQVFRPKAACPKSTDLKQGDWDWSRIGTCLGYDTEFAMICFGSSYLDAARRTVWP